ncbi:MAG: histidine phosphatase family protein [Clostridia bacterium]|nr:histidine phosphatase family protein [Clostridia bacterium]
MILYIIRHGEPHYETTGELTEKGWQQAEAVGKRMAKLGVNKIFASPILRAQQTAEPACRMLGLEKVTEEWSHEIGDERLTPFPDGKMKSISFVQNTYFRQNGNIDLSFEDAYKCDGINQSEMKKAVDYIEKNGNDFLERLGYKEENGVYRIIRPNDDKVALFCHAAFSRAWVSVLLHIPLHIMWAGFDYDFTGVTVIEFQNNENGITAPKCLTYADTSHLYAEGIDSVVNDISQM